MYFHQFLSIVCGLILAVTCCPTEGEEIIGSKSNVNDDHALRMLVWPPRLTRKNASIDQGDLRTTKPEGESQTTMFRNTGEEKVQDKSDTIKEEELISKEQLSNERQEVNQTAEHRFQNVQIFNKNVRMTNWVKHLPTERPGNPENIDIDSIQLTTSEPLIVPVVETVAVFRNAGSGQDGNNSFSVEVVEITSNVTQEEVPKNQSQTVNEESKLQHTLESSSEIPDNKTTEDSKEEIEGEKSHISESEEHNTEIYGKNAAEELAGLSVIDVLLRKRRNVLKTKRSHPEFVSEKDPSTEGESRERFKYEEQSVDSKNHKINVSNVNILSNVYKPDIKTIQNLTKKSSEDGNNSSNSNPIHNIPLITLSEIRTVKKSTGLSPELILKNTDSNTFIPIQQRNHSEENSIHLPFNSTHSEIASTNPSNSIYTNSTLVQKGRAEKNSTVFNESVDINSTISQTVFNNSTYNVNQTLNNNKTLNVTTYQIPVGNAETKITFFTPSENIRRLDEEISTLAPYKNNNETNVNKSLSKSEESDQKLKNSTLYYKNLSHLTDVAENSFNKSVAPSSAEDEKSNNTKTKKALTTGKEKVQTDDHSLISGNSTEVTYNHTKNDLKHQNSTFNGTANTELLSNSEKKPTNLEFTTTEKTVLVEKEATTEGGTIFEGFKSIADYIGFST